MTLFAFPHISLFSLFLLHLSLKCKMNFALCVTKSLMCVMLKCSLKEGMSVILLELYLLCSSANMDLSLLTVPVLYPLLHLLLSSIPSYQVHPRDMTRLCFVLVPCKVLTLCCLSSVYFGKEGGL